MTTSVGEGAQSGAEGTQSGAGENATGTNGGNDSNSGSDTQSGAQTTNETVPKAELDAVRERMKAADKRAADFEAKFKQLTEKDMPAQEKLARDYEAATQQVTALRETNSKLALENAFLSDNTYKWKNPKRALQLVDLDAVEIGDDGKVTGLKDALKALATSDPYMLEAETSTTTETTPPSTSPANNGGNGGGKPDRGSLAKRFPTMNTRVRRSG